MADRVLPTHPEFSAESIELATDRGLEGNAHDYRARRGPQPPQLARVLEIALDAHGRCCRRRSISSPNSTRPANAPPTAPPMLWPSWNAAAPLLPLRAAEPPR